LLIHGNSLEQSKVCAIRLHQSVSAIEYGNVAIVGNELSHLAGATSSQNFCIDTGTPNTAPKWVRNITFVGNHSNDVVTASVSSCRHLKAYEPLPRVTPSGRTVPGASPSTSP